ncbi:hypothetical protein K3495_g17165, partial [Podosphaera aphanis]
MWKTRLLEKLDTYAECFTSARQQHGYVFDQTEGLARDFLAPLVETADPGQDVNELIDDVVNFLQDPAEAAIARAEYGNLEMTPNTKFWEFYQNFRVLATTAGISDDLQMRHDLRDKILLRLRSAVVNEFDRCQSLREYASLVQNQDADYHA